VWCGKKRRKGWMAADGLDKVLIRRGWGMKDGRVETRKSWKAKSRTRQTKTDGRVLRHDLGETLRGQVAGEGPWCLSGI
jgi:hypothetical protein